MIAPLDYYNWISLYKSVLTVISLYVSMIYIQPLICLVYYVKLGLLLIEPVGAVRPVPLKEVHQLSHSNP